MTNSKNNLVSSAAYRLIMAVILIVGPTNLAQAATGVGTIQGKFSVSPSGSASYTVPIQVPPGITGMEPKLSLTYDSHVGNGEVGVGWSLNGLSAIHRCSATRAEDGYKGAINYDRWDRFCLDGQRLIGSTEPAQDGTGAYTWQYRTELWDQSEVIGYGITGTLNNGIPGSGPSWFRVRTKSGLIIEYGRTEDSRIEAKAGSSDVRVWALNKIQDRNGNYLKVTYAENTNEGEYHPALIEYTGNDAAGVSLTRTVEFQYTPPDTRTDYVVGYVAGAKVSTSVLLTHVITKVGSDIAHDYALSYDPSTGTGRSILKSITQCRPGGDCLPSTQFGWEQGSGAVLASPTYTVSGLYPNYEVHPVDADGDGGGDLLFWKSDTGSLALHLVKNGNLQPASDVKTGFYPGTSIALGDFSGRGKTEVLFYDKNYYYLCRIENGIVQSPYMSGALSSFGYTGLLPDHKDMQVIPADFDAWGGVNDGSTDVLLWNVNTKSFVILAGSADGKVFNSYSSWVDHANASVIPGEYNGDGITDVAFWDKAGGNIWIHSIENAQLQPQTDSRSNFLAGSDAISGDFNGDGVTDIAFWNKDVGNLAIYPITAGQFQAPTYTATMHAGAVLTTADYNNDGISDLLFWNKVTGEVWIHVVQRGVPLAASYTGTGFTTTSPTDDTVSGFSPGDFNGDGVFDAVFWGKTDGKLQILPGMGPYPDVVKNIADGIGATLNITYRPLTDNTVYTKDTGAQYPIVDVQAPFYIVSQYSTSNGLGGTYEFRYTYGGYKLDLTGRGSLGFRWTETYNPQLNSRARTTHRQDFPYIGQVSEVEKTIGGIRVEHDTTSWVAHKIADNVYLPYANQSQTSKYELNGSATTAVTTGIEVSIWGDVTKTTETITGGDKTYTKTITNYYNQPDLVNWRLGVLKLAVGKNAVPVHWAGSPGAGSDTRTSSFEYYSDTGLLKSEIVEPNNASLRVVTAYEYDTFGNKTKVTVSGSDVAPRITRYDFAPYQGYAPYSVTNAEGHVETYQQYDFRFSQPTQIKDRNGFVKTMSYDDFGRQKTELLADGTTITNGFTQCATGDPCPSLAAYYGTTTQSGMGPTVTYFDVLQREVRKQTTGFSGSAVYVDTQYDDKLRVWRKSRPYFANATSYWATLEYDAMGRVLQETTPDNAITRHTYAGLSTTVTADWGGKNQATVRYINAMGQLIQAKDADGNSNYYDYDAFGNLVFVKDALGHVCTLSYDGRGRKLAMNDPDMGHWEYQYYATGELKSQTDNKGQVVTMEYDYLGRMVTRVEPEGISRWVYDKAAHGIGKIAEVNGPNGTTETHTYDGLGRPYEVTQNLGAIDGNASYKVTTEYDAYSRPKYVTYPVTGFKVRNDYNAYGFLTEVLDVTNAAAPKSLWKANSLTAEGGIDNETAGNGLVTSRTYYSETGDLHTVSVGGGTVQNAEYHFDKVGNLDWRKDVRQGYTENFGYDNLNRLRAASVVGGATKSYDYDAIGNITYKSDVGYYQYNSSRPHAVTDISPVRGATGPVIPGDANGDGVIDALDQHAAVRHILGEGTAPGQPDCVTGNSVNVQDTTCINNKIVAAGNTSGTYYQYTYDANGSLTGGAGRTITYTSFNMPAQISMAGKDMQFIYDADHNRVRQISANGAISYIHPYYEKQTKGSITEHHHYLYGAAGVVGIYIKRSDNTTDTLYLHKDHLGSVEAITDAAGAVTERYSFDAFGARRALNWQVGGVQTAGSVFTNRGYTGHEQLDDVGLVHMNARLYDPILGRFLSADVMVQFPDSTQGLNRYSYTDNNPLSRIDPSGNNWASDRWHAFWDNGGREVTAVAAAVAGTYFGCPACGGFASGYIESRGNLKAAIAGAITAGVFYGVGTIAQQEGFTLTERAFAHAVAGGFTSVLQGGTFQGGFLSGGFAEWAGGNMPAPASTVGVVEEGIARVVIGGTASVLAGGKFANGAQTAAYAYIFNDCLHGSGCGGNRNPARSIADRALKDGHLSLSEANEIWRANNDLKFELSVDASQLTVKQVGDFGVNGTAGGKVVGVDWLVHGSVTLNRDMLGNVSIRPGAYDFQPHGSFSDFLVRNFETYGGFWVGSRAGMSVGTDFLINYSGRPNVTR